MNKITFVPAPESSYCEESQSLPFRMALCKWDGCAKDCDETATALHDFFKCRDFVAEALFSEQIDRPLSIYSFGWKAHYKDKPILNGGRLFVAVKGGIDNLEKQVELLAKFETECGMVATVIHKTQDKEIVVLESDIGWRKSVTLLNLYSLVVKSLTFDTGKEVDSLENLILAIVNTDIPQYEREAEYWQQITQTEGVMGISFLVSNRDSLFDIDWKEYVDTNTSTLHHGHGPVAFFTAVKWVRGGETNPSCCEVIKPSVLKFCEAA